MKAAVVAAALLLGCSAAGAQTISHRGFVEGQGLFFPEAAAIDTTRAVGDALLREEVFVRPATWVQLAAGFDLRANSHDQVEDRWRLDVDDRRVLRPRAAVRRLSVTLTTGRLTVDIGKQFIRWARTDVINPIDRFAPRDFLNVIDTEFLPVAGVRPSLQLGNETLEAVWVPRLTPSRLPLLDQRWTTLPPAAAGLTIEDAGSRLPSGAQSGARWRHTGGRLEAGLSYFYGYNHVPHAEIRSDESATVVSLTRVFPRLRVYGADAGVPTPWFSVKAEAAYFASADETIGRYTLYVVEVERQTGEWLLTGGYAGEAGAASVIPNAFDPERGLAPAVLARAAYTVDPRRTVTLEGAARSSGNGQYLKAEYSQALGDRWWRLTLAGVLLAGQPEDFLGQFNSNSHLRVGLRFAF